MSIRQFLFLGIGLVVATAVTTAQITTNGTGGGAWNATATWTGGVVPGGSETIIIAANDSLYFNVPVTITGTLIKRSLKRDSIGVSGSLTIGATGTYQHEVNGGTVPYAMWADGSTCRVTGVTTTAPGNIRQRLYHLVWDCPNQSTGVNLGLAADTIRGDVVAVHTGSSTIQLRLTNNAAGTLPVNAVTILGNVRIDSSDAYLTATGSSGSDSLTVTVHGDLISKGAFSLAAGSGAQATWYLHGNLHLLPGGKLLTHSSTTVPDSLIFAGSTKQSYVNASGASNSNVKFAVRGGSQLDMDTSRIGFTSSASFVLQPGATVFSGHPLGLQGNITSSVVRSLSKAASYAYNGVVAQVDSLMPDTVKNFTVNNVAGVALSQPTVVTGVLHLQAGELDNSVHAVTIAAGGSVQITAGTVKVNIPGWTSVSERPEVPASFEVAQNFPNPFNPATTISYALPTESDVSVKVYNVLGTIVDVVYAGRKTAGYHSVVFDASRLASGVYFYRVQAGNLVQMKRMVLVK